MHIAQKYLSSFLDSLKNIENLELALRVYGHQKPYPPQDCDDTKLEVPFAPDNVGRIKHRLGSLNPKGSTPIAHALEMAQYDFTPCDHCRNLIILITDGIEECGGDPCEVSRMLQKKGIILKPFVIGIGSDFSDAFDCVGNYYNAASEKAFGKSLNAVISQALNTTTAQVNLLDEYGEPSETNVAMTFYDNYSEKIKYNFIHTLNHFGVPDTLVIDPLLTYNLVVHTLPETKKDSISLTPGQHTIIPITAPQGYLTLKIEANSKVYSNLQAIVRKHNDPNTLYIQNINETEKYLTGLYDLEVLCLPRIHLDGVEIKQNHTTKIEIPMPGVAIIRKFIDGYASLFTEEAGKLNFIYNIPISHNQTERLILQPGNYLVVFRSKFANKSVYTIEEKFRVNPGKTIEVKLKP